MVYGDDTILSSMASAIAPPPRFLCHPSGVNCEAILLYDYHILIPTVREYRPVVPELLDLVEIHQ